MTLDLARAAAELAEYGIDLRVLETCASTQSEGQALAALGAPSGTAVVARSQAGGRGRFGRAWVSPAGGLYVSLVLRPGRARVDWPSLGLVAALAALDAVEAAAGPGRVALKWPNDLLVEGTGRKLAGTLASVVEGSVPALVVGLGLNLAPEGLPPEGAWLTEVVPAVDGARVLVDLLAGLTARVTRWEDEGPGLQLREWWSRSGWAARRVRVQTDAQAGRGLVVEGVALGLAESGALRLCTDAGNEIEVDAGDVSVLDAA